MHQRVVLKLPWESVSSEISVGAGCMIYESCCNNLSEQVRDVCFSGPVPGLG